MITFGKQTYHLLDIFKPYQRPELSHAGCVMSTANAELKRPTGVGSSDLLGQSFTLMPKPLNFFVSRHQQL
jgi:hypothetical protein